MTAQGPGEVTQILAELSGHDSREVIERLLPLVYDELRTLAEAQLRHEREGHTLRATALVHEAYLRMLPAESPDWTNRRHFFAAASQAMRRILIEHARGRARIKRGGDRVRVTLSDVEADAGLTMDDVLALDAAIERLKQQDARMAEIVQLRFFAGLSVPETAEALDVSESTVKRDWAMARAWLYEQLNQAPG